jgi:diguanylate cyclase (GGDEF)-like protein/putative nucleotidyltransferase with HDIG domain
MGSGEAPSAAIARLEAQNAQLRERLAVAERHTAQTLLRATRLAQVISVLGHDANLDTLVERTSVEIAELFAADIALLMLGAGPAMTVAGHYGVRDGDLPRSPFALPAIDGLTAREPVRIGPAEPGALPGWLDRYGAKHVAWVRLLAGDESLGTLLLVRRADEPFVRSDEQELRAIASRIAMAIENCLLHQRMRKQLAQLRHMHRLTTELTATLELQQVGARVAEMLVSEAAASASAVFVDRGGELVALSGAPAGSCPTDAAWERFPLEVAGKPVGRVDVAGAPAPDSDERELLLHMLGLAALALDKALLYEHSRELARHDSLTGLLGHRVFHEVLERILADGEPFSVVLVDIDDFKQINDLHGHQAGDEALRRVAERLRQSVRGCDSVFRVGGEEFCAVLPGLRHDDAFVAAERLRRAVAGIVSGLPVTVSTGVASYPVHGDARDELLAQADAALYASKRHGKNRTTIAGAAALGQAVSDRERHTRLALLHEKDPETVAHSVRVATLAVEIARALGVEDERLDDLRTAAKLHDIGKIGVPDAILSKPGPLDDEELRIMQTHPIVGAELLAAWGLPRAARFVLEHHERFDGSGYPARLRGEEIALEARVIHVADAYVAMTMDRPYRQAMSSDAAFAELQRHRGTQFDPDVVDTLLVLERQPRAERDTVGARPR